MLTGVFTYLIMHVLVLVEIFVPLLDVICCANSPQFLNDQLVAFVDADQLFQSD